MYAMRKLLLFSVVSCFGLSAAAQNVIKVTSTETHSARSKTAVDVQTTPTHSNGSKVSAVGVNMGQGPNAYGPAFNPWTNVWADEDLNAISFIHRSDFNTNGDNTSGSLRYDLSTDGGSTFNSNAGPVWNPTSGTGSPPGPARYPQATIYNPSGNTNVNNAYLTFFAPTLSGHNGSWGGLLTGSQKLDGTNNSTMVDTSSDATGWYVVNEGYTAKGDMVMGLNFSQVTDASGYTDTLMLIKGMFNSTNNNFDYSKLSIYVPFGSDTDGDPVFADARIEMAPGSSQTGYISINGYHASYPTYGLYHPIILKTTNNGASWSSPSFVNLDKLIEVESGDSLINIFRDVDTSWVINNLSLGFEHDVTVDANGNPHIFANVCPAAVSTIPSGGSAGSEFSIFSGINAMVDIFSTDGGTTWACRIVGAPQTFRGGFGVDPANPDLSEDNRPQLGRSDDGNHIFYFWFDTDAQLWGTSDNVFPDCWMNGYDVVDDELGTEVNITNDINSQGTCTFGCVAPQVWADGNNWQGHVVIQQLDQTTNDVLDPTQYIYYPAAYTFSGVSVDEYELNSFELGQNFPNPANGDVTRFKMNVIHGGEYQVEVINMMGQVVMTKDLGALSVSEHLVELNVADLQPGVYFYTVSTEGSAVSKKMIVE